MGVETNYSLVGGELGCKQKLFEGHKDFGRNTLSSSLAGSILFKTAYKEVTQKEFNIDI
jgi:hypothetical protein